MKKAVIGLLVALCLTFATTAGASTILVSATGTFPTPNTVVEFSFAYNPLMGPLLIQSYGFGGSSNAPGGRNATGSIIAAGGFDTIVGLFAGGIGGGGARLAFNDDGTCGPGSGAIDAGFCFDSTLAAGVLPAGTYTVSLTVFSNFPPGTETGAYPGGGSFSGRTANYALDVVAPSTVPEPGTMALLASGLAALRVRARRKRA